MCGRGRNQKTIPGYYGQYSHKIDRFCSCTSGYCSGKTGVTEVHYNTAKIWIQVLVTKLDTN